MKTVHFFCYTVSKTPSKENLRVYLTVSSGEMYLNKSDNLKHLYDPVVLYCSTAGKWLMAVQMFLPCLLNKEFYVYLPRGIIGRENDSSSKCDVVVYT